MDSSGECSCVCKNCCIGGYCIIQKGEHAEGKCVKACKGLTHFPKKELHK